jgi:hypothetical protein
MSTRVKMRDKLVEALKSGEFAQAKGVRKDRSGAYSLEGLVGKVAAKLDVGHRGARREAGVKALAFGDDGLVLEFSNGFEVDLSEANDSGVTFPTLAGMIEDWRADRRKANEAGR